MAYSNFKEPFLLHTDASETGLGAVLYQQQNGVLRVIAYGSCTLSPLERNYHLHSGKLEFLPSSGQFVNSFGTICIMHLHLECIQTITH